MMISLTTKGTKEHKVDGGLFRAFLGSIGSMWIATAAQAHSPGLPERTRGSNATEGESKDPEGVSFAMPIQGVLSMPFGENVSTRHSNAKHLRDPSTPRPSATYRTDSRGAPLRKPRGAVFSLGESISAERFSSRQLPSCPFVSFVVGFLFSRTQRRSRILRQLLPRAIGTLDFQIIK
jgi:hypothetical protein